MDLKRYKKKLQTNCKAEGLCESPIVRNIGGHESIFNENKYRTLINSKLSFAIDKSKAKNFFRLIKNEIQNILGIKVNYRELSTKYLKMKNKWYVNDRILDSLRFTDYVLPTASLNQFKRNLVEIFKEKSVYFEYIIVLYKSMNPQRYTKYIINSEYFKDIDTLEKAYWLGFLLAECHIRATNSFSLGLSVTDGILIKDFCKAIGFDYRRIGYSRKILKSGKIGREFRVDFSDKDFVENLIDKGIPKKMKSDVIRFPYWMFSDKRLVMAMLLGYFDGDGTHGYKYPNSLKKEKQHNLFPRIRSNSRQLLEDIKSYFDIKYDINPESEMFSLTFEKELFNELIDNYKNSLERKRFEYRDREVKFKIPKETLIKLYDKGWTDYRIAGYHLTKYSIKIDPNTVDFYAKKWNIQRSSDPMLRWRLTIKLLGESWSLDEIYTKEFGYKYDPTDSYHRYCLKNFYEELFEHDSKIKDTGAILRNIVDIYGNLENNLIVMTQRERVILKSVEGWSLERIYAEVLGYKYDPSNSKHKYLMRKKFQEIFSNDPSIMNSADILERIKEVYNPVNKL